MRPGLGLLLIAFLSGCSKSRPPESSAPAPVSIDQVGLIETEKSITGLAADHGSDDVFLFVDMRMNPLPLIRQEVERRAEGLREQFDGRVYIRLASDHDDPILKELGTYGVNFLPVVFARVGGQMRVSRQNFGSSSFVNSEQFAQDFAGEMERLTGAVQ